MYDIIVRQTVAVLEIVSTKRYAFQDKLTLLALNNLYLF